MAFQSSAVPGAIDGLLALVRGLTATGQALSGLVDLASIYDGAPTQRPSDETFVIIAESPMDGVPAVEGTQKFVGFPARERDEDFTIHNAVYSRSGDTSMKAERDRAFVICAAIERGMRALQPGSDMTLGDSVDWCEYSGRLAYTPQQTEQGAIVRVNFDVVCKMRLLGS